MLSLKLLNKEKGKKQFVEETPYKEACIKYTKDLEGLGQVVGESKVRRR